MTKPTEKQEEDLYFLVIPPGFGCQEGAVGLSEDEGSLIISQVLEGETDVLVLEDDQVVALVDGLLTYLKGKHKISTQ